MPIFPGESEMPMNRYDLVIFDLDGTLLDSAEGLFRSLKNTIEEAGLPPLSDEVLSTFLGPPVEFSFRRYYDPTEEQLAALCAAFRKTYTERFLFVASPYEGIFDVFAGLRERGIMPAVATYKRHTYAIPLLKHFGFDRYTDILYGQSLPELSQKSDIIRRCITDAGVTDLSRVLMVGDTIHDAGGAAALGVDFLGVTYGFGLKTDEEKKKHPSIGMAETAPDILNFV